MSDELDDVAPAHIPGTEEVYRELSRKADLLRRGELSETDIATAFDDIVGTDLDGAEGYVPEGRDEKVEEVFAGLERQARELEKQAKGTNLDVDKQIDYMTREPQDIDGMLAGLGDIKF